MNKTILYHHSSAVRSTYAMAATSIFVLVCAFVSFRLGLNGPSVVAGAFGGLLVFMTLSRLVRLNGEQWFLAFDEGKSEFEWFCESKRQVVSIANIEKVEHHQKMRADGESDSIVTFFVGGAPAIDLPNEFSDIVTIDKVKSVCKAHNIIFVDCRDEVHS